MLPSFRASFFKTTLAFLAIFLLNLELSAKSEYFLEPILRKNTIYINGKKSRKGELKKILKQKPNKRFLGLPLGIYRYRLGDPKKDSIFHEKIHPKEFGSRLLSKKQSYRLAYAKNKFNQYLLRTPPIILDSTKTQQTVRNLKRYLIEKGYLTSQVKSAIQKKSGKAWVSYFIDTGPEFRINKIHLNSKNPIVDSLFQKTKKKALTKEGDALDINLLKKERDQLYQTLKNHGFFDLKRSHIKFSIDTSIGKNQANIHLNILPKSLTNYTISSTNVYMTSNSKNDSLPKIMHKGLSFFYPSSKPPYKPRALSRLVYIKPNQPFSLKDKEKTYSAIKNSRTFKPTIIDYSIDTLMTNHLMANIRLSPKKKYAMNIGLEGLRSNIQDLGVALNYSFLVRNFMRRVSTLEYQISANVGRTNTDNSSESNGVWNAVSLDTYVRFFLPNPRFFLNRPKDNNYLSVYVGFNTKKNIGLDKIGAYTSLNYRWTATNKVDHSINFIKLQYIKNTDPTKFFDVYTGSYNVLNDIAKTHFSSSDIFDSDGNVSDPSSFINTALSDNSFKNNALSDYQKVNDISNQKERIIADNLIVSSNYSISKNIKTPLSKHKSYFYLNTEVAGNILSLLAPSLDLQKDNSGNYTIFDIPFSQYAKFDLNYTKHWWLGKDQTLSIRGFMGMAVPFGNASSIPFIKSYFSGGANDVRGWRAYSLGPGRSTQNLTFNEANFKLTTNLEYRFGISKSIKSALFIDAGNIWNIWNEVENEEVVFNSLRDLGELGVSIGTGIRYDFSFLILRLDLGLKAHNPSSTKDKWFGDFNFSEATYHFAINYPF